MTENRAEQTRISAILRQMRLRPQRLRGQNFLIDTAVVDAIMAVFDLSEQDRALEIGPGLGALTLRLAEAVGWLKAVEIEPDFTQYLRTVFALKPQVEIFQADALTYDYAAAYGGDAYRIYANIPYNITTPLLKRLLLSGGNWQSMVLLLQREAAERIAQGKGKANGPLTLLTAYYADAHICRLVPKSCFYPAPQVDSALLCLKRRLQAPVPGDITDILSLAEAGFAERRKMLLNSLAAVTAFGKDYWQQGFAACDIGAACRAEDLHLADFARLSLWHQHNRCR